MLRDLKGAPWVLVLVGLVVAGLLAARNFVDPSPPVPGRDVETVRAEAAGEHVGATVRVCGRVVQARYLPGVEGRPTFLNFGASHPRAAFTAVIWQEARARFTAAPEDLYAGREVCVRGRVTRHEGTPQIEVATPAQMENPPSSGAEAR